MAEKENMVVAEGRLVEVVRKKIEEATAVALKDGKEATWFLPIDANYIGNIEVVNFAENNRVRIGTDTNLEKTIDIAYIAIKVILSDHAN